MRIAKTIRSLNPPRRGLCPSRYVPRISWCGLERLPLDRVITYVQNERKNISRRIIPSPMSLGSTYIFTHSSSLERAAVLFTVTQSVSNFVMVRFPLPMYHHNGVTTLQRGSIKEAPCFFLCLTLTSSHFSSI